jgi:hypothetical protein
VERYPKTFAPLGEDRLSDLLAATLTASLANAQREVFTRNGKSDIFVQADVLKPGAGPDAVFICESKWATSDSVVSDALDPQLFGYMTAHDTRAVLLLLVPQAEPALPLSRRLAALRSVEGFQSEAEGPVAGWPVYTYSREGRLVSVCIASILLPRQPKSSK